MIFFPLVKHFHFLLAKLPTYCSKNFSVNSSIGYEQGDIFIYVLTEMSLIVNKKIL